MAAFEMGLAAGTDGIELDVNLTGDGEIVVIPDDAVNLTTAGKGPEGAFTLAELQALAAGSWFAPECAGVTIPTLKKVLELLQDKDVLLNIEVKTG